MMIPSLQRLRNQGLPVTAQVLLLVLAAIALAQTITFAVILATPLPPPPRLSLAAAQSALATEAGASSAGLNRRIVPEAPFTQEPGAGQANAAAIAHGLAVDAGAVRVRYLSVAPLGPDDDRRALVITLPPGGTASARLEAPEPVSTSPETAAAMLASHFPLPPFEAAWLRPDGRWVHVTPRTPLTSDWRFRLLLSLLLGMVVVVPLAWLAARRLTRSIRALGVAARESRLGVAPAFPDNGPPEVREASGALSQMHGRIERQYEDRMRMLVAIAHDLRTPLTALRLRIETTEKEERMRQVDLIQRVERMISEILNYAATGKTEPPQSVDVSALIREIVPEIDGTGKPIALSAPDGVLARLPPIKLGRAVANVVDNAIRYAQEIEVSILPDGENLRITVADRGPGVAEADIERIQEPFERLESSRSRQTGGIGLGLTIARDLVVEMDGALTLSNRDDGGLIAIMDLPVSPSGKLALV